MICTLTLLLFWEPWESSNCYQVLSTWKKKLSQNPKKGDLLLHLMGTSTFQRYTKHQTALKHGDFLAWFMSCVALGCKDFAITKIVRFQKLAWQYLLITLSKTSRSSSNWSTNSAVDWRSCNRIQSLYNQKYIDFCKCMKWLAMVCQLTIVWLRVAKN